VTGNVAEFVLSPVLFPSDVSNFVCHIEPLKGYVVYDIEYSVFNLGDIVNDVKLSARKIVQSHHPKKAVDLYVSFSAMSIFEFN